MMRTPPGLTILPMFWRANFWSLWSPEREQNVVDQVVHNQIQDKINQITFYLWRLKPSMDQPEGMTP